MRDSGAAVTYFSIPYFFPIARASDLQLKTCTKQRAHGVRMRLKTQSPKRMQTWSTAGRLPSSTLRATGDVNDSTQKKNKDLLFGFNLGIPCWWCVSLPPAPPTTKIKHNTPSLFPQFPLTFNIHVLGELRTSSSFVVSLPADFHPGGGLRVPSKDVLSRGWLGWPGLFCKFCNGKN